MVTEFEFRLHPVGPLVYAGMILHPRAAAAALLRFYRDFMDAAPDEVCGAFALLTAPPADVIPEPLRGQPAAGLIVLYAGDPREGEQVLRPLLEWGDPWLSDGPTDAVRGRASDDRRRESVGHQRVLQDRLPARAARRRHRRPGRARPPRRVHPSPVSSSLRSAAPSRAPTAPRWRSKSRTPSGTTSARRCGGTRPPPQPKSPGRTRSRTRCGPGPWTRRRANFISADEGQTRLRASYGEQKYERLVALKNIYDPGNVFALNPNIAPTAARRAPWTCPAPLA